MDFMQASRSKFRYNTPSGNISTEDLWDLPLSHSRAANLDDIAKGLSKELKSTEESFVKPATIRNGELQAKFDIVISIIKVKMAERDEAEKAAVKKETKQKIMALIEQKKDAALAAKPIEELQALVNGL